MPRGFKVEWGTNGGTGERGKADSLERSKERKERGNGAAAAEVGERRGSWEAGRQAGWLAGFLVRI